MELTFNAIDYSKVKKMYELEVNKVYKIVSTKKTKFNTICFTDDIMFYTNTDLENYLNDKKCPIEITITNIEVLNNGMHLVSFKVSIC